MRPARRSPRIAGPGNTVPTMMAESAEFPLGIVGRRSTIPDGYGLLARPGGVSQGRINRHSRPRGSAAALLGVAVLPGGLPRPIRSEKSAVVPWQK